MRSNFLCQYYTFIWAITKHFLTRDPIIFNALLDSLHTLEPRGERKEKKKSNIAKFLRRLYKLRDYTCIDIHDAGED